MIVYATSDGISKAIPFVVLPIIANYLTTAEFGLVMNYSVFVQFFGAIIGFSTQSNLNVHYYKTEDKKRLLSNLVATNMLLFLGSIIFVLAARGIIEEKTEIGGIWQILALVNAFGNRLFINLTTKLRLDEKPVLFGKIQLSQSVTSASLSILFVIVLSWSWQGRIFSLLITAVTMGAIAIAYLMRRKELSFKVLKRPDIVENIKYGLPLLPHTMASWLRSGMEKILISDQLGNAMNGVFSMGTILVSIFTLINNAFFSAFSPYLFKRMSEAEKNPEVEEEVKIDLVRKSYAYMGVWIFFLAIGYFVARVFILYALKEEYHETLEFLPYLVVALFFGGFYNVMFGYVLYFKKNLIIGGITMSAAVIHVLTSYFFLKEVGLIGVAYSKIIVNIFIGTSITIVAYRLYPMPWLRFDKILKF